MGTLCLSKFSGVSVEYLCILFNVNFRSVKNGELPSASTPVSTISVLSAFCITLRLGESDKFLDWRGHPLEEVDGESARAL